jgi:3-deoxy-D-manno-octulosonic acid kinase
VSPPGGQGEPAGPSGVSGSLPRPPGLEGFAWSASPRLRVAADAALRPALAEAGLLDVAGVCAHLAAAAGARGRAPLAVVELPGGARRVALRSLRRGGWLGPLLGGALARGGRPFAELAVTARLLAAGAPVPQPLLAIAWRSGAVWRAALGTAFLDDAVDAATALAAPPPRRRLLLLLATAGRAVRRFHDVGGSHPDLHVGNLLVRERGGAAEAWIVDLDGARAGALPGPDERMAQLMRLHRSLVKRGLLVAAGGERGSLWFLHAYVAGDRALRRALLARLPAERRRLARHALLYPRAP